VNAQRKNVQLMPEQLARQKMLLSLWKILLPLTPPHLTTISPPDPAPKTPK
jgi:hypothetical protein